VNIPIIFEDSDLIVIDKPSGVIVNKAESVKTETVQEWIEKKFSIFLPRRQAGNFQFSKNKESEFYSRAGIVHRLDKETSGILLIAKTPDAFENLQAQFKNREVTKKYITLAHGKLETSSTIKASVGRLPWNRERFGVLAGGRDAETSYDVLKHYKSSLGEIFSLLDVTPLTGRTHQIRIHLKYAGHPVACDPFYGGRKVYKRDLKFCPRLFLHAAYIKFKHPKTNSFMEFRSKLPQDLDEVLEKLASYV